MNVIYQYYSDFIVFFTVFLCVCLYNFITCVEFVCLYLVKMFHKHEIPPVYNHIYPRLRRRQWHPTPVLLPGKSHGQRSLLGCNPWGR